MTPAERWWEDLGDSNLSDRIEVALATSYALEVAWERLREADAIVATSASAQRPTLDATADAAFEAGGEIDRRSRFGLGLEAAYEIDLL